MMKSAPSASTQYKNIISDRRRHLTLSRATHKNGHQRNTYEY